MKALFGLIGFLGFFVVLFQTKSLFKAIGFAIKWSFFPWLISTVCGHAFGNFGYVAGALTGYALVFLTYKKRLSWAKGK